jgi:hypothetical protein
MNFSSGTDFSLSAPFNLSEWKQIGLSRINLDSGLSPSRRESAHQVQLFL